MQPTESLHFSIIVPVYNRPNEMKELLESLREQTATNFEVLVVEDGSSNPCREVAEHYAGYYPVHYFYKENEERSIARNYGMARAKGNYFLFFDSDCVIPPHYIAELTTALTENYTDAFGGPDDAHTSFTPLQKAINYSMTSFFTTGGIRGGKVQLEKFTPRSFNMGFSRAVYEKVGGFRVMMSEDIDISTRIKNAGFTTQLIRAAYVYHKRRVSLPLFWRQVYGFGWCRIVLSKLYPGSLRLVYLLPTCFVLGVLTLLLTAFYTPYSLLPLALYFGALFLHATVVNRSIGIGALSIITSFIQLAAYGLGFIHSSVVHLLLRRELHTQ